MTSVLMQILLFVFSLGGSAVSAHAADEGLIQVKSIAEVDGKKPEITIGDLIVSRGVSEEALKELRHVRLADTPNPGESRSFTEAGLEQVFQPHLREIQNKTGEKISLKIPTRVKVVRKSFQLKSDDVAKNIKNQLSEICADCQFEISGLVLPSVPTTVPAGSTWTVRMRSELPKGNFSAPLEVNNEDGSKRTYWVSGSLVVNRKVPVASRTLQLGERLRPEDYNLQSRDITFANDLAAGDGDLATSIVARSVAAGQIIWRGNLKRDLAVKSGDVVKVVAGQDGWQITIDGIAQGSAYIGDLVKVKIPRTQKLISGLLTERGIVEVH